VRREGRNEMLRSVTANRRVVAVDMAFNPVVGSRLPDVETGGV